MEKKVNFPVIVLKLYPDLRMLKLTNQNVLDSVGFDITVTRHVVVAANNVW